MAEHQSTTLPAKCKVAIGYRSGKLLVTERLEQDGRSVWKCECDCGETKIFLGKRLTGKQATKSCGCQMGQPGLPKPHAVKHGLCRTRSYSIWCGMKDRCLNPRNAKYDRYGGRGIFVCDGFLDFQTFYDAVGDAPSSSHSIDRIDNDSGYTCGNCRQCNDANRSMNVRWATKKQQANNRESNNMLSHRGFCLSVSEWSSITGISRQAIETRLLRGWTVNDTLTTPVSKSRSRPIIKDDSVKQMAVKLYLEGNSLADVARTFGCCTRYIGTLVEQFGETVRTQAEQMMLKSPLSDPQTLDEIAAAYTNGRTLKSLCVEYGTSVRVLKRLLTSCGVKLMSHSEACKHRAPRGNKYEDPNLLRDVIDEYSQGASLHALRRKYGGKDHHLRNALVKAGVKIRNKGEQISISKTRR